MTLKTKMQADAVQTFLNTDEFAETITYTPYGGTNKSIKALVDRKRLEPMTETSGRFLSNTAEVMIANHATYGVTSVAKGYDKVIMEKSPGGDSQTWLVIDVMASDDGMWHLLVQK